MKSLKRRLAEALAEVLGVSIFPKVDVFRWPEDDYMRRLFEILKPDCIFDVGANVGQYGRDLRRFGYEGEILSFEPAPHAYQSLQEAAVNDSRWHTFPFALGAQNGTVPFHVMEYDVFSSFLSPSTEQEPHYSGMNAIKETVAVEMKTLNSCFMELSRRFGFQRPFLKMDTQGYDLEVVRGGNECFDRFVGILSEVAVRRLYDGAPLFTDSIQEFESLGFRLARLFPVHPSELLSAVEFNCYLTRADLKGLG